MTGVVAVMNAAGKLGSWYAERVRVEAMQLASAIKELYSLSKFGLPALVPAADDPVWDVHGGRQAIYGVHRDTRSIVFRWLTNDWANGTPLNIEEFGYASKELTSRVLECATELAVLYGGRIVKLMLAEL